MFLRALSTIITTHWGTRTNDPAVSRKATINTCGLWKHLIMVRKHEIETSSQSFLPEFQNTEFHPFRQEHSKDKPIANIQGHFRAIFPGICQSSNCSFQSPYHFHSYLHSDVTSHKNHTNQCLNCQLLITWVIVFHYSLNNLRQNGRPGMSTTP